MNLKKVICIVLGVWIWKKLFVLFLVTAALIWNIWISRILWTWKWFCHKNHWKLGDWLENLKKDFAHQSSISDVSCQVKVPRIRTLNRLIFSSYKIITTLFPVAKAFLFNILYFLPSFSISNLLVSLPFYCMCIH